MKGKIFNAQGVQALIAGNKTQFREVIKPQPIQPEGFSDAYFDCYNKGNQWNWWTKDNKQFLGQIVKCPYQVGQKIFVKESFYQAFKKLMYYKASWESDHYYKNEDYRNRAKCIGIEWSPAQHMKQEHSRLTLEIKEIRVESLGGISEEDAIAEGVERTDEWTGCAYDLDFTDAFKFYWNSTHKKPEEKFEANPWVWKIEFEAVK